MPCARNANQSDWPRKLNTVGGPLAYYRFVSGTGAKSSGVDILEWRSTGHRMTYVAAIARAANESGRDVVLWTAPGVPETREFQVQISELTSGGRLAVRELPEMWKARVLIRHLAGIRANGRTAVLPEADRFLHVLVLALVARQLPRSTIAIVMRPPQSVSGRWRGRLGSAFKTALTLALVPWPSLDVQLLEDPLAAGPDRVWSFPILSRARFRLDDPCTLFDFPRGELPNELQQQPTKGPFLAVVGVIDDRKNLPLILDAWRLNDGLQQCDLVVAGKQSSNVSTWLRSVREIPSNVVFIDRYLSDAEIRGVLENSAGILTLYDGGLSSGIVAAGAAVGRWVITLTGSRTGSVASKHGFGVSCPATARGVAAAMQEVLAKPAMPVPVVVPTSRDFGRHVLRRLVEPRDDT